jgi:hypothetical protein
MSEDQQKYLMCSPIDDRCDVPGSVEATADCGHQIWLSPSGLRFKLNGGIKTRCQDCVDPDEVEEIATHPEGEAELAGLMGQELSDVLIWEAQHDPPHTVRTLQADSQRRRRRTRR